MVGLAKVEEMFSIYRALPLATWVEMDLLEDFSNLGDSTIVWKGLMLKIKGTVVHLEITNPGRKGDSVC